VDYFRQLVDKYPICCRCKMWPSKFKEFFRNKIDVKTPVPTKFSGLDMMSTHSISLPLYTCTSNGTDAIKMEHRSHLVIRWKKFFVFCALETCCYRNSVFFCANNRQVCRRNEILCLKWPYSVRIMYNQKSIGYLQLSIMYLQNEPNWSDQIGRIFA
jgi:hypothetical protein